MGPIKPDFGRPRDPLIPDPYSYSKPETPDQVRTRLRLSRQDDEAVSRFLEHLAFSSQLPQYAGGKYPDIEIEIALSNAWLPAGSFLPRSGNPYTERANGKTRLARAGAILRELFTLREKFEQAPDTVLSRFRGLGPILPQTIAIITGALDGRGFHVTEEGNIIPHD